MTESDWRAFRAEYPALDRIAYLNTAGGGPISRSTAAAAREYYRQSLEDGDIHWNEWMGRCETVRALAAAFVRADKDDVALLGNATVGLNIVAALTETQGDVLFVDGEFPSCTLPWISRGVKHRFVPRSPDGSFGLEDLERTRDSGTRTLVLSAVQYATGYRADLAAIGSWCRDRDITFVVDGTQSVGAFPVDVRATHIDALVFSGYKWVTAGYGIAALVLSGRLRGSRSVLAGWRSQADPYALAYAEVEPEVRAMGQEGGHPPFPNVFALGAALEGLARVGPDVIARRVLDLADDLHDVLDRNGVEIVSARDTNVRSGIVMTRFSDPKGVARRLRESGVLTSARGPGIRFSIHAYNDASDLDALDAALRKL